MTFNRDCLLPSVHVFGVRFASDPVCRSMFVQGAVATLGDDCTGYANLSYYAAMEAAVTGDHHLSLNAISFRNEATALLRQRIHRQGRADGSTSFWSIPALMSAEIAAGNYRNAICHGRMLCLLWQQDGREERGREVDLPILEAALYSDIQRASMTLTRPLFDLDGWVAAQIHTSAPHGLPRPDVTSWRREPRCTIEVILDDPILIHTFKELNELHEILHSLCSRSELFEGSTFLWLSARGLICEGRLVNHYLDLVQHLDGQDRDRWDEIDPSVTVRACVSLAALYWTRRATCTEGAGTDGRLSKCGDLVHHAGPLILNQLDRLMPCWHIYVDAPQVPFSHQFLQSGLLSRLRLWTLYMAAVAEQSQAPGSRYAEMPHATDVRVHRSYARQFAEQVKLARLSAWNEVEAVLQEFLYRDDMSACGEDWFRQLVCETHAGESRAAIIQRKRPDSTVS
jgi:hypothetical protein